MLVFALTAASQSPDKAPIRPHITGISHIAVYTSDAAAAEHYYVDIIGAVKRMNLDDENGARYSLSTKQYVEVLPLPPNAGVNRLDHIAWNVDNAEAMRRYLASKSWKVPAKVEQAADGSFSFQTKDPEGNKIEFVQPWPERKALNTPNIIGRHIIHVGFLVHDRALEDTFYRDLLGFKPYWFGGMQKGKIDWVSQQAPDSHDWLEYMLTSGPSGTGIPANISQRSLGVLDHLSIGVDSVDVAYKTLKDSGRLEGVRTDAHTQIGKDGKGQFNLYDPDGIRLELMNFHATEEPCCSPFTADDPTE